MTTLDNFVYFNQMLPEYLKTHLGKFVIIADGKEQGFYDSFDEAYQIAVKSYGLGNFIVQQCVSDEENTSTFYSPLYR